MDTAMGDQILLQLKYLFTVDTSEGRVFCMASVMVVQLNHEEEASVTVDTNKHLCAGSSKMKLHMRFERLFCEPPPLTDVALVWTLIVLLHVPVASTD